MQRGALFAGRYRVLGRLGNGAMGAVYEVLDTKLDCRRALKVMLPHTLDRPELRERFAREAKVVGPVDSEYIVDVLDAGVDEATSTPYLVMKLLAGEDLSRRLARLGRLTPEETIRYLRQIALALGKTHRLGIVHRDLKPSNLFVEEREGEAARLLILDFGLAKALSRDIESDAVGAPAEGESDPGRATSRDLAASNSPGRTDATRPAGTPHYMAPEQFRRDVITSAADIHAVGMIAFTLLVGRTYWTDERELETSVFESLAQRGAREPASLRARAQGVELSAGFDGWFACATATDPKRRFPSAATAVNALADVLGVAGLEPLQEPAPAGLSEAERESRDAGSTGLVTAPPTEEARESESPGATRTATRTATATDTPTGPPSGQSSELDSPEATKTATATATNTATKARKELNTVLSFIGFGVAAVTVGALAWRSFARAPESQDSPSSSAVVSPLRAPGSVIACPVLAASGVEEPSGWLGAAAAATICERARVLLGGDPARTLVPAELLDLPRPPTDDFPADVYSAPDVRSRSLEAARKKADAYIDGSVERAPSGEMRVTLLLHSKTGVELARGQGTGRALYEAARSAMAPLVGEGLLPKAERLDPMVADFARTTDPEGALLLIDTWLAVVQNAGTLPEECKKIEARRADLGDMGLVKSHVCSFTLGLTPPAFDLSSLSEEPSSPGGVAARALLLHFVRSDDRRGEQLVGLYQDAQAPWARSILAATASCLLQSSQPETASRMALRAVHEEPTNLTGDFCRPWGQAHVMSTGTSSVASIVHARQAWQPMEARAWVAEPSLPIAHARRAYTLSPYATDMASTLADLLLRDGKPDQARMIALKLADQGYPVHRLESEHLLLRLDAAELRFGAALEKAKGQMVIAPEDAGWVRVQRVQVAWRALGIGLLLGRAAEVADLFVERFIDPTPAAIDFGDSDVTLKIPAICAYATRAVAARCFARLRGGLSVDMLRDTDAFARGAERFATGDMAGAAGAWRPILGEPGPYVEVLGDALITAFESAGETAIVEKLEREAKKSAETYAGAGLGTVRAARRAAREGRREEARTLATRVLEAWSAAADPLPAVAEMKRLLAKLR